MGINYLSAHRYVKKCFQRKEKIDNVKIHWKKTETKKNSGPLWPFGSKQWLH